jgi:hypothetical protein
MLCHNKWDYKVGKKRKKEKGKKKRKICKHFMFLSTLKDILLLYKNARIENMYQLPSFL